MARLARRIAGGQRPVGDQRLPAAAGRHPVLSREPGHRTGHHRSAHHHGLRADVEGRRRLRPAGRARRLPVQGRPAPDDVDDPGAVGGPADETAHRRTRRRDGVVRRRRTPRAAVAAGAPRRSDADRRKHPRPRGGLVDASGRPNGVAAHRKRRRRRHVHQSVHPQPVRRRLRTARRAGATLTGRGRRQVRAQLGGQGADAGPLRARRPAGRGVRVSAGATQGSGHADPRTARAPRTGAGDAAGHRRRRPLPGRPPTVGAPFGVAEDVVFTEGVPAEELPAHHAMADVFAMPCRTRGAGLDVEGLGIVYLEASAMGVPVVAGDSGGAPESVLDGTTGLVVDGWDVGSITAAVGDLLADPDRAAEMGRAGRTGSSTNGSGAPRRNGSRNYSPVSFPAWRRGPRCRRRTSRRPPCA